MTTHRAACSLSATSTAALEVADSPLRCPCSKCHAGDLLGECRLASVLLLDYTPWEGLSAKVQSSEGACERCGLTGDRGSLTQVQLAERWGSEVVERLSSWMEHYYWWCSFDDNWDRDRIPPEYHNPPADLRIPERRAPQRWKPSPGELSEMALAAAVRK